jgi:ectoine hydroxylase-related dioxygenase (phytanoyl-CoA dioxygenase family)
MTKHAAAQRVPPQSQLLRLAGAPSAEIVEALQTAGCAIIEGAVDNEAIQEIAAELTPWFEITPPGEGLFFGRGTKRFGGVFAKAPVTARLALAPEILAAAERVLLGNAASPNADCIQIHLTQAIEIGAGEPAQLLHRDDDMFPFPKPFEVMLNVMWPLDPFTLENGATRLAPGSQNWRRELVVLSDDGVVDAVCEPGSAIMWLGSLVHGGGANRSRARRRGLVISYSLAWLAQAEKLLLSVPPEYARALPERLQRLIGYQVHRPNLGWVEGRDPKQWLDGDIEYVAAAADNLTLDQAAMLKAVMGHMGRLQ